MSWQAKARAILENRATPEPKKPQKAPDPPFLQVFAGGTRANSWGAGWLPVSDEDRRERAYMMLEAHPEARYAVLVDADSDPVVLTLAVRGVGCRERRVAQDQYDPFRVLAVIERYSGVTVH